MDYSTQDYIERARQYCSSEEGRASLSSLAKKAEELSDLLTQSMIPTPASLTEPTTI